MRKESEEEGEEGVGRRCRREEEVKVEEGGEEGEGGRM